MNAKIISLFLAAEVLTGCASRNDGNDPNREALRKSTTTVIENYFKNQVSALERAKEARKEIEDAQKEHFNAASIDGE